VDGCEDLILGREVVGLVGDLLVRADRFSEIDVDDGYHRRSRGWCDDGARRGGGIGNGFLLLLASRHDHECAAGEDAERETRANVSHHSNFLKLSEVA
jgi:hypothetical protein